MFSQYAELPRRLRSTQLVLTGEGALDAQTLMGKGVGELAALCQKLNVPCIGLAGVVPDGAKARRLAPFAEDVAQVIFQIHVARP